MKFKHVIFLCIFQMLSSCSQNYQVPRATQLKGIDKLTSVVCLRTSGENSININNVGWGSYFLYSKNLKFHDLLYHGVRETPLSAADYEFITEKVNQIKLNSRRNKLSYFTTDDRDPPGVKYYVRINHYGKHKSEILNCDIGSNKIIFNIVRNRLCDKMRNENYEMGACFLWKHEETFPRKQE